MTYVPQMQQEVTPTSSQNPEVIATGVLHSYFNTHSAFYRNPSFIVTDNEWDQIHNQLGKLCHYAARNVSNSNGHAGDKYVTDDLTQDCMESLITAAMSWKRLMFVNRSIQYIIRHCDAIPFALVPLAENLVCHWGHRKCMAGKNSFGSREHELNLFVQIISQSVDEKAPNCDDPLVVDSHFVAYAKTTIWNTAKNDGIKLSEDRKRSAQHFSLDACPWLSVDVSENMNALVSEEQLKTVLSELHRNGFEQSAQVLDTIANDSTAITENGVLVKKSIRRNHHMAHHTVEKHLGIIRDMVTKCGGIEAMVDRRLTGVNQEYQTDVSQLFFGSRDLDSNY